jgi:hypothetical protein
MYNGTCRIPLWDLALFLIMPGKRFIGGNAAAKNHVKAYIFIL